MKKITIPIVVLLIACIVYFLHSLFSQSKKIESGIFKVHKVITDHSNLVMAAKFSNDGKYMASAGVDSTVRIYKVSGFQLLKTLKHPAGLSYMDFSNDGNMIVTTSYDKIVRVWSWNDSSLLHVFSGHNGTPWSAAFSPHSDLLATGSEDATIKIWNLKTGGQIKSLDAHKLTIWSLAFSPDGETLASGSFDNHLKIWNVSDWSLKFDIEAHDGAIVALAFSCDGKILATASDDKKIKLWNPEGGSLTKTLEGSGEHVQGIAFSPDAKQVVTSGRDKNMAGELVQNFTGDSENNRGVSMRLWDVSSGEILQTFSQHRNDVNDVDFSSDGNYIVSGSSDKSVIIWKLAESHTKTTAGVN